MGFVDCWMDLYSMLPLILNPCTLLGMISACSNSIIIILVVLWMIDDVYLFIFLLSEVNSNFIISGLGFLNVKARSSHSDGNFEGWW